MKRHSVLMAGIAVLTLSAGQAAAASCAEELASLTAGTTTGSVPGANEGAAGPARIAKDGSAAPMQTNAETANKAAGASTTGSTTGSMTTSGNTTAQAPSAPGQGIAKDGSTMPMANQPGGGNTAVATSRQDAQAQQGGSGANQGQSPARMAALEKARDFQRQGNEAGCMQALQEAKSAR